MKHQVSVLDSDKKLIKVIEVEDKSNLLDSLLKAKIKIGHSCEGNASCGTCKFFLISGQLNERNSLENDLASQRQFKSIERLSCQSKVRSDLKIQI